MQQIPTGQFITHSAQDTFEFAYSIGEAVTEPMVFLLYGDLGTGKTVFAKGIAAGLEIDPAEVTSPTFTIANQYDGRMRLYHLDLYRIEGGAEEVRAIGMEEILEDPEAIVVIEWPERLGGVAIPSGFQISIFDLGGESRRILMERID